DDVIEADAAEAHGRFGLVSRVGDDRDWPVATEYRARPRGVLADEADVDAPGQMRRGEVAGVARIENLAAALLQRQDLFELERIQLAGERCFERRPLAAVQPPVVGQVRGRI